MNSSNNNSNNNYPADAGGDYDCYGSGGFDFVYENTKPNEKHSKKSHNFREINKAEERNEKVDALIGELPKKMQKQLKTLQITKTVKKVKGKNKSDSDAVDASQFKARSCPKSATTTDFSSENSEYYEGIDDAAEELQLLKYERKWEAYLEWLNEEYEEMQIKCHAAYDIWMHYQEYADHSEWSWITEMQFKKDYEEYCAGIKRMTPEVWSVPETRTIKDYEADTLRKESALSKALEIKEKIEQRKEMRIKIKEMKQEEEEELRTRCYFGRNLEIYDNIVQAKKDAGKVWLEMQFADAVKMDKLLSTADLKFTEYMIWLEEDGYQASDRRYITWSQKMYEKAVAEDESKYDELPLHERYTWCNCSDSEDDDDSEDDSEDDCDVNDA